MRECTPRPWTSPQTGRSPLLLAVVPEAEAASPGPGNRIALETWVRCQVGGQNLLQGAVSSSFSAEYIRNFQVGIRPDVRQRRRHCIHAQAA